MQSEAESVFDYLTQADPVVGYANSWGTRRKYDNTTNKKWLEPKNIMEWEDFNLDSLRLMYDGLLQKALSHQPTNLGDHSSIPKYPFCEIHDENSLESLFVKWTQSIVGDALHGTQAFLENHQIFEDVYMVRGGQACYPGFDSTFRPDWAGVQRIKVRTSKPKNILPGDTKLGKKFSSQQIEHGRPADCFMEDDWIAPLKQVYNYCIRAKTRYGYILSEKELVALHIRPASAAESMSPVDTQSSFASQQLPLAKVTSSSQQLPIAPDQDAAQRVYESGGVLEYKAVPWQCDKSKPQPRKDTLTVNLALWWLHLMAMENHTIQYSYTPLHKHKWHPSETVRMDSSDPEETAMGSNLSTAPGLQEYARKKRKRDDLSDEESDFLSPIQPLRRASVRLRSKVKR